MASTTPDMASFNTPARRLQTLLQSLPPEYSVIRDAIDAQKDLDVELSFQKLMDKEAQLKADETVIYDRGNYRNFNRQRRSSSSDDSLRKSARKDNKSRRKDVFCLLCEEKGYKAMNCDQLKLIRKALRFYNKHKEIVKKDKFKKSKQRAYNAEKFSNSDDVFISFDNCNSEEDIEEIAALFKEIVSKFSRFY
ncbi:MAG: hypothetical protein Q9191_008141 [Dirinaria sp. TL-2023a]